jgi:thiol-disulfide isomerase/thioredoxin
MIRRILLPVVAAMLTSAAVLADDSPSAALERQLAEATKSSSVTVVHLWAPWCSNCKAELANGGWSGFIAANPDVNFVFATVWNSADGHELLERNGVGGEKNFRLLLHPNGSRKHGEMVTQLLGLPISWLPRTWVFKDGELRYAMNYGELHFPVLQQLVRDSSDPWDHPAAK